MKCINSGFPSKLTLIDQDRVNSTHGRYSHKADQTNIEAVKVVKTLMRRTTGRNHGQTNSKNIQETIQVMSTNEELLQFSLVINTCMSL